MRTERNLNSIARRQHGVLSMAQAQACGFGKRAIASLVRSKFLVRLHPGVFALAGAAPGFRRNLMAAVLAAGGEAFVSHAAAACLLELGELAPRIEISVPWTQHPRLARPARVHRVRVVDPDALIEREGFRVTKASRTLLDLAGTLDRDALERVLDHALVRRKVSRDELLEELARAGAGRRGARALRALVDARPDSRARVESPLEQKLHRILERAGLEGWRPNLEVLLATGRRARLDVAFPGSRLAIEVDGYVWHAGAGDGARDQERRNALIAAGWRILALTAATIEARPAHVLRLVRDALRASSVEV